jgi:hypothetical protein
MTAGFGCRFYLGILVKIIVMTLITAHHRIIHLLNQKDAVASS